LQDRRPIHRAGKLKYVKNYSCTQKIPGTLICLTLRQRVFLFFNLKMLVTEFASVYKNVYFCDSDFTGGFYQVVFIRENIKVLFILFLPVYFFIAHQSLQNKHTHFYANGIMVTHSHPISTEKGEPVNEHSHSPTEICFYQLVNIDYFSHSGELHIELVAPALRNGYKHFEIQTSSQAFFREPLSRGPPSA
jgi:hypothetical protein